MHGPSRRLDEREGKPGHLPPAFPLNLLHGADSQQLLPQGSQLLAGWFLIQPEGLEVVAISCLLLLWVATPAPPSLPDEVPIFSSLCLKY